MNEHKKTKVVEIARGQISSNGGKPFSSPHESADGLSSFRSDGSASSTPGGLIFVPAGILIASSRADRPDDILHYYQIARENTGLTSGQLDPVTEN